MIIKRKKNIVVTQNTLEMVTNNSYQYFGIIFFNTFTPKVNNPSKILLNYSYIYLKNHKYFPMYKVDDQVKLNNTYLFNFLVENYQINKSQIKIVKEIYQIPKITLYLIYLDKQYLPNQDEFTWKSLLDFYTYDLNAEYDDLYQAICNNQETLINHHLNNKLYPNKYIRMFVKVTKLYESFIGDNIVKHDNKIVANQKPVDIFGGLMNKKKDTHLNKIEKKYIKDI